MDPREGRLGVTLIILAPMGLVGQSAFFSSQGDTTTPSTCCSINTDFDLDSHPLVFEEHINEVEEFIQSYPDLTKNYIPIAVIGEGTFSTVFKAIDVNYWARDNSSWSPFSRQDPDDPSKIYNYFARMGNIVKTRSTARALNGPLNQAIKHFVLSQYFGITEFEGNEEALNPEQSVDLEELKARFERFPPQCVAIKRINATSGPKRIAEEINFLQISGGEHHVIPIISGMRHRDQVLFIFPYFRGEDFRIVMMNASPQDIADYMKLLFEALAHLHRKGLIHRDVKPSNFLFARKTDKLPAAAVLVDFGLAQRLDPNASAQSVKTSKSLNAKKLETIARLRQTLEGYPPGIISNDPRPQMRASRAGTRGFRAPEVLFKLSHQSVLIDVWSAGVILLTLLTRRYPFFHSNDDTDAIVEIATLFGNAEMRRTALAYHRTWSTNIPSIPEEPLCFKRIIKRLAPAVFVRMPEEVFDLLEKTLKLLVDERCTAEEAVNHPFITKYSSLV